MATTTRYLTTAALTAAAMYWLDHTSGRRRRARLRDQLVSASRRLREAIGVAGRDLGHRLDGLAARLGSQFHDTEAGDEVLAERVRAALGRAASHPGAIDVTATDGHVVLSGAVLAHEHEQLMRVVRAVRGVRQVMDRLAVHERAQGIPALQGGRQRRPPRFELLQESWSPAARLLTGAAGGLLVLQALRYRNLPGVLGAMAGGLLLARSTANAPLSRLAGTARRGGIDIHKTLYVNAPLERVFETLSRYENFPAFMRNVRHVQMQESGRSRWTVAGPAGVSVQWDSETTVLEPNRRLAWRTVAHSAVDHAGTIQFDPFDGGTRLTIRMSYRPPGGALGHVVAKLFGADPKTELDEDMIRLKSFLETGRAARDAAAAHPPEPPRPPLGSTPEAAT